MEQYDVIVIGAGSAGSSCAVKLAESGRKVALIERDALGGSCLNYGCDPTKTAIFTAKLLSLIRKSDDYGISLENAQLSWWRLQKRIANVKNKMRGGSEQEAARKMKQQGITLIYGEAAFLSSYEVTVNDALLAADHIVLATGSEPAIPPIMGLQQTGFLTNKTIFDLPTLPANLLILGGGPIGVEFAQLFARFGSKVTLVEESPHILPKDELELTNELATILKQEGINLLLGGAITAVSSQKDVKKITITFQNGYEQSMTANELLIAAGRRRAYKALQPAKANLAINNEQLIVNSALQTNVPHIWAAGDLCSEYQFTHIAWRQGEHVARNILNGTALPFEHQAVPWVTYTEPELAHVGKTSAQLEQEGIPFQTMRATFSNVARAKTTDQTDGHIKLLINENQKILGAHILGAHAGELLGPILVAMNASLPYSILTQNIWPYPTLTTIFEKLTPT